MSEVEKMITDAGLNAPRVTEASITAKIDSEMYIRTPEEGLTVCKMTLKNGFSFIGHSACVSPENYNREIGDKIARDNAFRQVWSHEGYLLKEVLYQHKMIAAGLELARAEGEPKVDPTDSQAALGQKPQA